LCPGCALPLHYHTGAAHVYTLSDRWVLPRVPRPAADGGLTCTSPSARCTPLLPGGQHRGHGGHRLAEGAQVSFNDDGTFHSLTDAVLVQHLTETLAAARGIGPVGYIRGNGADVNGS
jgi:hypothetical protein